ncbi:PREDICTED: interleukin-17 receptor C [Elephantulus edwardii]|uniref:interleukin-17 receptor C n=1 Tax=Elephantulus edwardii TaxID=28737 RepID=UPI0003F0682D|nr:PREDICTED: interleukin-17 receptor C [Elephantulus edwardii]
MPVSWFLLSLALGHSPQVTSLERLPGSQNSVYCSPGLSCHLWDGDMLCLPGTLEPAPGPVLVPASLQTELVLKCHQETSCDPCVRVDVRLAVHGHWEEPVDETFRGAAGLEHGEPSHAFLHSHVVLSFQAYPAARCVLLEVQVPTSLVQPHRLVGSVVFDCFEAALGDEVQIWSYTQPRYQKELNFTQQLPDCRGLEVQDSIQSCWAQSWLSLSADGDNVRLVLDVSDKQRFSLSLYWDQVQGPPKPRWQRNVTGPQNVTLNYTELVPCLCIQVWPLEPDSIRTNLCPFGKDPRAHQNLWRVTQLQLLPPLSWRLSAPCEELQAEMVLCWQAPHGGPCQPLVPPLSRKNVTINKVLDLPLLQGHPNLCVQVSSLGKLQLEKCLWTDSLGSLKDDMLLVEMQGHHENRSLCALESGGCTPLPSRAFTRAARFGEQLLRDLQSGQCERLWNGTLGVLWACPMDKYIHKRWVLVWLACMLFFAVLLLLFLLRKNQVKVTVRSRRALLLYSADDRAFERLVGALASALCQLPLRVAVDLWSRQDLSAQGPLAWFHAQRRLTLQERGVVILLFSPGAVARCREWLQAGAPAGRRPSHDAFTAGLSCMLPDFLQGRATGRYVGACFDRLLPPDTVPALFHTVPVFSLPAQLPDFLEALQGPGVPRPGSLRDRAEHVARALQPALDGCFRAPGYDQHHPFPQAL